MALSFSVDNFLSIVKKRGGLQSPNRYSVYFGLPQKANLDVGVANDLSFLAQNIVFTGRSIATSDYKLYGPIQKIARESIYTDMAITFILTGDMSQRKFFDKWLHYINNTESFDIEYYDHYKANIYIGQLKPDGDMKIFNGSNVNDFSYAQQIEDAFPTNIGEITLGYDQNNTYGTLTVSFTFRKYKNLY